MILSPNILRMYKIYTYIAASTSKNRLPTFLVFETNEHISLTVFNAWRGKRQRLLVTYQQT